MVFYMRLHNAYVQTGRNPKSAEDPSFLFLVVHEDPEDRINPRNRDKEGKGSFLRALERLNHKGGDNGTERVQQRTRRVDIQHYDPPLESAKPTQKKTDVPQYLQRRDNRPQWMQSDRYERRQRGPDKCFNCSKSRHRWRECKAPLKDRLIRVRDR